MFGGKRLSRSQYHLIQDLAKAEIEKLRDTPIKTAGEAEEALGKIDRLIELMQDAHWVTEWSSYC